MARVPPFGGLPQPRYHRGAFLLARKVGQGPQTRLS